MIIKAELGSTLLAVGDAVCLGAEQVSTQHLAIVAALPSSITTCLFPPRASCVACNLQFKDGGPVWQEKQVCQAGSMHSDEDITVVGMLSKHRKDTNWGK